MPSLVGSEMCIRDRYKDRGYDRRRYVPGNMALVQEIRGPQQDCDNRDLAERASAVSKKQVPVPGSQAVQGPAFDKGQRRRGSHPVYPTERITQFNRPEQTRDDYERHEPEKGGVEQVDSQATHQLFHERYCYYHPDHDPPKRDRGRQDELSLIHISE